jgi:hypothetical protein
MSGFFLMPAVKSRLERNYLFSKTKAFVPWALDSLQKQHVRILRQHVSGDYYSAEYTEKWCEIVSATAGIQHFAYTRSWAIPEILPALKRLARFPNMQLWFSADVASGRPPRIPGLRGVAWMARDKAEEDQTPRWATLVFRDEVETLRKKINGIQVCPHESGMPNAKYFTCTKCQICCRPKN